MIQRSIELNPNRDGHKYLSLAEMLTGTDAVDMYYKGIEVLKSDQARYQMTYN